jgi:hypothetical protein
MVSFQTQILNFGWSSNGRCWYILCPFGQFSGHLAYILWPLGIFSPVLVHLYPFWYVVPRKIWQPCATDVRSGSVEMCRLEARTFFADENRQRGNGRHLGRILRCWNAQHWSNIRGLDDKSLVCQVFGFVNGAILETARLMDGPRRPNMTVPTLETGCGPRKRTNGRKAE